MLKERLPMDVVGIAEWQPYPAASDRTAWAALPAACTDALVAAGETALAADWPALPASLVLDYVRKGDRGSFEGPHFHRRGILLDVAMAECAEGSGRFADAVADAAWSICEETWWGWPAHLAQLQQAGAGLPDADEPSIDLGVGETAGVLAWVSYLLADALDAVSPMLRRRIASEMRRRVVDPYLERDEWWFTKVHNWNPWCHSNILAATLAVEPDPERRSAVVAKALRGLDTFIRGYPDDGGCDEGPTYWTRAAGCLFDCLELLAPATRGAVDVFDEPLIGAMGRYIVAMHIDGDWWVNFADGSPTFRLPGAMVYRYGQAIGDTDMAALGADAARRTQAEDPRMAGHPSRMLPALFGPPFAKDSLNAESVYNRLSVQSSAGAAGAKGAPLVREAWLPGIQVMTARSRAGSSDGLFVAAKAGHNAEVHNHNDVGSFVVYRDGAPVLIDPGVTPYTALTFSARRYELWTMQSGWHNVPVVNGVEQHDGPSFAARDAACERSDERVSLRADIAGAYPAESSLVAWTRTVSLHRGAAERVEIVDAFEFDRDDNEAALHLITHLDAIVKEPGAIDLGGVVLTYDPTMLEAELDGRDLDEPNLTPIWGPRLTRIRLVGRGLPRAGILTVSVT